VVRVYDPSCDPAKAIEDHTIIDVEPLEQA
jgi:hypothetical protein